jgi:hypothetical protein
MFVPFIVAWKTVDPCQPNNVAEKQTQKILAIAIAYFR